MAQQQSSGNPNPAGVGVGCSGAVAAAEAGGAAGVPAANEATEGGGGVWANGRVGTGVLAALSASALSSLDMKISDLLFILNDLY